MKKVKLKKKNEPYIYIKKWMRTKHEIFFTLSNKIMQCIFNDKTEIILSLQIKIFYYIDKEGKKTCLFFI